MKDKKELLGVLIFYAVIIIGVIVLNARMEKINSCIQDGNSENYCVEVGR